MSLVFTQWQGECKGIALFGAQRLNGAAHVHHGELSAQRDELNTAIAELEEQMAMVRGMLEAKGTREAAE